MSATNYKKDEDEKEQDQFDNEMLNDFNADVEDPTDLLASEKFDHEKVAYGDVVEDDEDDALDGLSDFG